MWQVTEMERAGIQVPLPPMSSAPVPPHVGLLPPHVPPHVANDHVSVPVPPSAPLYQALDPADMKRMQPSKTTNDAVVISDADEAKGVGASSQASADGAQALRKSIYKPSNTVQYATGENEKMYQAGHT